MPRPKSTKSIQAPVRLVTSGGKTCVSCVPEEATRPIEHFYKSTSPFHADGLVPMCKECIVKHSFDFTKNTLNLDGFLDVLRQIDKPFIKVALDMAYADFDKYFSLDKVKEETRKANAFQVVNNYFKALFATSKYKTLRWRDGDITDTTTATVVVPTTDSALLAPVTDDMRKRFGLGFTDDDYRMLEVEYQEWCDNIGGEPMDKSKREVIKNCCYLKLAAIHGLVDGGNISQLITSFNNSLSVGALKPQEKKSADANPLGVVIRDIQNYTPAEYYRDKYVHKDVQQFEDYIERFVCRPMRNVMLGERNEDSTYKV